MPPIKYAASIAVCPRAPPPSKVQHHRRKGADMLRGKLILLIVAGGIAAFKSLELVRRLRGQGALVRAAAPLAGAVAGGH